MSAVEVSGLRKQYGGVTVVDDLSFTIEQGEVFALLGPNGAGCRRRASTRTSPSPNSYASTGACTRAG